MESFYGTFKSEFIRQNRFETDQELNESTLDYVYGYYNHIRPHSSNGYMTPFEKRYSNQWFFSVWMLQKCLTISKPTPRFTVVVVLDTPPFWLHMAITLHIILTLRIFLICYYCFLPIRRYWIHAWQYFGFFWFDLISDTSIISYCLSFSNLLIMCRISFLVSEIFKNPIFTTSRFAYFIK